MPHRAKASTEGKRARAAEQLHRMGIAAPVVFAGCEPRELMRHGRPSCKYRTHGSSGQSPSRSSRRCGRWQVWRWTVGTGCIAPCPGCAAEVAVVAWQGRRPSVSRSGRCCPRHEIAALSARIPGLWPPGQYALGAAAAHVVEGVELGTRRRFPLRLAGPGTGCGDARRTVGRGREAHHRAVLSQQERTALDTLIAHS